MRTIYITGIKKYKKGIDKGLEKSDLIEGRDYIQGLGGDNYALYWINDDIDLRDFKKSTGVKYVWKHRLRFYNSLEEMNPQSNNDQLSDNELALMNRIKNDILNHNQHEDLRVK